MSSRDIPVKIADVQIGVGRLTEDGKLEIEFGGPSPLGGALVTDLRDGSVENIDLMVDVSVVPRYHGAKYHRQFEPADLSAAPGFRKYQPDTDNEAS